jgi:hypothetical protein
MLKQANADFKGPLQKAYIMHIVNEAYLRLQIVVNLPDRRQHSITMGSSTTANKMD